MQKSRENRRKPHFRQFLAQIEVQKFVSVNFVVLVVEHHGHLLEYAKSAKSNEAKSRKSLKTSFWNILGHFFDVYPFYPILGIFAKYDFFVKII